MKALWAQRYKADQKGLLKEDREIPKGKMVLVLQRIARQEIAGDVKCRCLGDGG